MIDRLDTAASYLDSDRLEGAESVCGTVLKAKPDRSRLITWPGSPRECAHLYVETVVAHRGIGAYGAAVRAAQQLVHLAPDAPNGHQTLANLLFHRGQLPPGAIAVRRV